MRKLFKDSLIRRFISASFFAAAFVWVAVTHFGVETEAVWAFFMASFVFVGAMVAIGLVLAPLVRRFNRKPPFLARLSREGKASGDVTQGAGQNGQGGADSSRHSQPRRQPPGRDP